MRRPGCQPRVARRMRQALRADRGVREALQGRRRLARKERSALPTPPSARSAGGLHGARRPRRLRPRRPHPAPHGVGHGAARRRARRRRRRPPPGAPRPRRQGLEQPLPHHQRGASGAPRRAAARPAGHARRTQRPPRRAQRLPTRRGLVAAPRRRPPGARARGCRLHEIFGRDYFIELQHELLPDSGAWLRALDLLAHELRLPTVATNDVHYIVRDDAPLHDVLAAEAANQPLPNPLGRRNAELYLKSPAQMRRLFQRHPEALRQHRPHRRPLQPRPRPRPAPLPRLPAAARRDRLLAALQALLRRRRRALPAGHPRGHGAPQARAQGHPGARFRRVLPRRARHRRVRRGRGIYYSGRGSAGNTIVSYVLRITDADPIDHELLFERFLNPARREMPDIDIDFCSARRDEVIEYIYERFGDDRVAMVATVKTVHAPSAVRIVAAPSASPRGDQRPLKAGALGQRRQARRDARRAPRARRPRVPAPHYRRLVGLAERLGGFPMGLGTHLGGFILSRDTLTDRVPLQWAAKGVVVAQFDKDDVETLGLVKMDILGLRMHSAIAEAVHHIEQRTGRYQPWELPRDDPAVYELSSRRAPSASSSSRARASATSPRACASETSRTSSPRSRSSVPGRCRQT